MENELFSLVGVSLSSDDVATLCSVLSQYIFELEHHISYSGEVIDLGVPATWGKTPLAPILDRLKLLRNRFDSGDALFVKKSCS